MGKRTSKLAALAAMGLIVGLLAPTAGAGTPVLTVRVGADVPKGFSARIYAPPVAGVPTLRVHKGDVVNLLGGGLGLLPVGTGPHEFYSESAGGIDRPFSFFSSDPDPDLVEPFPSQADIKLNPALLIDAGCGNDAASPCIFDGSGPDPLNPGDRDPYDGNFFVQIDANPNETVWGSPITGVSKDTILRIDVVPGGDAATTQAEVDAAFDHYHALDVDEAQAIDAKLRKKATSHKVDGKKVWDAYVGYDTDVLALFAMYPQKIVLNKGDTVRYHFDQLNLELHSAVLPIEKALDIAANGFAPVCDPDGDAGTEPDNFTVDFETFTCEPGTGDLELDLLTTLVDQAGNGVFNGSDLENSGLRAPTSPEISGGPNPWDVKFKKKSSAKGFEYICGVHGREMHGFVVVK